MANPDEFMTAAGEESLARLIARGGRDARDRMLDAFLPLASRAARAFGRPPLGREDALASAVLGLVQAATGFRPGQGRFAIVAVKAMRRAIRDARAERVRAARELGRGMRADPAAPEREGRPDAVAAVRRAMAVALDEGERRRVRRAMRHGGGIDRATADKLRKQLAG